MSSVRTVGLSLFGLLGVPQASGQGLSHLEEVVVTAQKRVESIQEVPIAITAFSAGSLSELRIQQTDDLERYTPNLTWKPAGGAGGSVGLRGVVDTVFTTNQVGSVGIVVDDVGLNSPTVNTASLFDVERVEILRGPQVTLYGRSTTGGAVSIVTRKPHAADGFNGRVMITLGSYGQADLDFALGAPVGESAAFRLAGLVETRDGFMDNPVLDAEEPGRDRVSLRAAFAGQAGGSVSFLANAHMVRNRGDNYRYKDVGMLDPETGGPCATIRNADPGNGCVDGGGFVDNGNFSESFSNFPTQDDLDVVGGFLNLQWQGAAVSLTSITAYENSEIERSEDTDGGPFSLADVHYSADTDQFSQEVRLASDASSGRFRWIVGAYYMREQQDGLTANSIRQGTADGPPPQFRSQAFRQTDTIYSGYAQLDVPLAARWTLTFGGRYSQETKKGLSETLRAPGFLDPFPPLGTFIDEAYARSVSVAVDTPPPDFELVVGPFLAPYDRTWKDWGGKISVNFKPTDQSLLYGSVSRGFKGGTFNFAAGVRLSSTPQRLNFQAGVDPERLITYEVGGKFDLLDESLRVNVALFRNDYTDQQTFTFKDGGPVLVNAAESTIDGAELELQWTPGAGWLLSTALGLLDAGYDRFIDTDGTDYSGNRMIQAPRVSWSGFVRRQWSIGSGQLTGQAGFQYTGEQYFGVDNARVTLVDATTKFDARLGYGFGDQQHYEVAVWGRNLNDERYCAYTGTLPFGNAQCIVNEPRTYGLSLAARFR